MLIRLYSPQQTPLNKFGPKTAGIALRLYKNSKLAISYSQLAIFVLVNLKAV
jgi:hypothetical protein